MWAIITVVLAAVASFAIGAFWYGTLSGAWIRASGVPVNDKGQPRNASNPMLYVGSFLMQLLVAGMMRHVFEMSALSGLWDGAVSGFGIGLFFIAPWIALNNAYAGRPILLSAIDGGYAALGCAAMGAVLGLL